MTASPEGFSNPVELLRRFFSPEAQKAGRFSTDEMEARQAALFGYAYAVGRGLDSLEVSPGEGPLRDYDARFRWYSGLAQHVVPVQLKRLPPESINRNETLEGIIKKAKVKCTGDDLLVAIHVDRAGHITNTTVPKEFRIQEICFWGWSKPNQAELVVNSYKIGSSTGSQWFVPFPPPGFRRSG